MPRNAVILPTTALLAMSAAPLMAADGPYFERVATLPVYATLPEGADPLQLSMLTVNPPTASLMLSEFVPLAPGEWVIQNVANSGVGGYLVQLARLRGLHRHGRGSERGRPPAALPELPNSVRRGPVAEFVLPIAPAAPLCRCKPRALKPDSESRVGEPTWNMHYAFRGHVTVLCNEKTSSDGEAFSEELERAVAGLSAKAGPVLYQLPHNMKRDDGLLADFLALLPARQAAFEFRHASWLDDAVFSLLHRNKRALCVAETEDLVTPRVATADWGYLRLRRERYGDKATFDVEVNWLAKAMANAGAQGGPHIDAAKISKMKSDLKEMYAKKIEYIHTVINKDNKAMFMSRGEPDPRRLDDDGKIGVGGEHLDRVVPFLTVQAQAVVALPDDQEHRVA